MKGVNAKMIYHTNSAAYGRVRTASGFSEDKKGVLDTVINCGWHDVNDLYRISGRKVPLTFCSSSPCQAQGLAVLEKIYMN